jgi:hypothetical protein
MGVIADFPHRHIWRITSLPESTLEAFARFDAFCGPPGWGAPPEDLDDDGRRLFGRWVQLRLSIGTDGGHDYDERFLRTVRSVAESDIPWAVQDAHFLWEIAACLVISRHTDYQEVHRIPLAASRSLTYAQRRQVMGSLQQWHRTHYKAAWRAIADQVNDLLTESEENDPAARVRNAIWERDGFACLLTGEYGPRLGDPLVHPLLLHWCTASSAKPADRWIERAGALLTPEASRLIREILGRLPAHRETSVPTQYDHQRIVYLDEFTARVLRGMVWTCELIDEPWVPALLGDVAVACGTGPGSGANCRSELIANAVVTTLSRRGGLDGVAPLARIQAKVRKKSVLANVARTLDAVAAASGLNREQTTGVPTASASSPRPPGPGGTRSPGCCPG